MFNLQEHTSLVRQMLAYNTGTIVGGGLILATILSTFCQPRWTMRPIVLLGLIFLTLGFGMKTLLQGYQLNTERQHYETVVRKMKAQQSDMLQRVLQLEQSMSIAGRRCNDTVQT